MSVTVVVGAQWGDEGKGKIIDLLAKDADYNIRFHGGPNAGHTIRVGDITLKLHHIPSAVLRDDCLLVIANGVVVDPQILLGEIDELKNAGIDLNERLIVSKDCHLILPYHRLIERISERVKQGNLDTRSTGRGIGPVHADKVQYRGIKIADLYRPRVLAEKLRVNLAINGELAKAFSLTIASLSWYFQYLEQIAQELKPYVAEAVELLHRAHGKGADLLFEGAQGTFLDVDHGFYPFVTASNAVAGAINAGAGIPPRMITRVVGVAKAYATRVGDGPFPTEMDEPTSKLVQEKGAERGTTTGRLRRVGWFDAEMVRTAATLNGFDELALTKIDVLAGLNEPLLSTEIWHHGRKVSYLAERDPQIITQAIPVYARFDAWDDLSKVREFDDLPPEARGYIEAIGKTTGVPIKLVSVGPERSETITL